MNVTINPISNNIEFNLYDLVYNPIIFNIANPEYLLELFLNLSETENLNYIIYNFEFLKSENKELIIEFIEKSSMLAISKILRKRTFNEFVYDSDTMLSECEFILDEKYDFYFTDGFIYIDNKLEKVYKLKNNKLVYIFDFLKLNGYELKDVNKIYITGLNYRSAISEFKSYNSDNIRKQNYNEFNDFVKRELCYKFSDIENLNENIIEYMDDLDVISYLEEFVTEEKFNEFKRRENEYTFSNIRKNL